MINKEIVMKPAGVLEIRHVDDCHDGSLIKEILLTRAISRELIYYLGKDGEVFYYGHFPRPFFKIRVVQLFDLKGIEGNNTLRVHLKRPDEYPMDHFVSFLEGFS